MKKKELFNLYIVTVCSVTKNDSDAMFILQLKNSLDFRVNQTYTDKLLTDYIRVADWGILKADKNRQLHVDLSFNPIWYLSAGVQ